MTIQEQHVKDHFDLCAETAKQLEDGPWSTEPDRFEWSHAGLNCLIVRNAFLFNWCGYVGVPRSHAAYGKDYHELHLDVHGGLTYSEECRGVICHVIDKKDNLYWLGFDCGHFGDFVPYLYARKKDPSFIKNGYRIIYRNFEYVKRETEHLANQLALYEEKNDTQSKKHEKN